MQVVKAGKRRNCAKKSEPVRRLLLTGFRHLFHGQVAPPLTNSALRADSIGEEMKPTERTVASEAGSVAGENSSCQWIKTAWPRCINDS
jgi:hypothetical protein